MNSQELNAKYAKAHHTKELQQYFNETLEEENDIDECIYNINVCSTGKVSPFFFENKGKLYACGKTFAIKEDLKEMGFKFSQAYNGQWVK